MSFNEIRDNYLIKMGFLLITFKKFFFGKYFSEFQNFVTNKVFPSIMFWRFKSKGRFFAADLSIQNLNF